MKRMLLAVLCCVPVLAYGACQRVDQMVWAGGQFPLAVTSDYGEVSEAQLSEIVANDADVVKMAKALEGKGAKGGESIAFKAKTVCDGKETVEPTVVVVGLAHTESAKIWDKAFANAHEMIKKVAAKGPKK